MFDFSGGLSQPQTSVYTIGFALALTLVLSLLLVLTYEKTSRQVSRPDHFIQSLLLMSLVTCTIMQSIGDSLALSFGIFGALAIIRFRTRISDPRDVAFVFASMAVGIACGVHSFLNGIIGTVAFVLVVVVIRFSPFGQKSNMLGSVRVETAGEDSVEKTIIPVLKTHCHTFALKRMRYVLAPDGTGALEYEFRFKLKANINIVSLVEILKSMEAIKLTRIGLDDENDMDML